jgi:hypothetical protein
MVSRVHEAVRDYEKMFWESDPQTQRALTIINGLRAVNEPLRQEAWRIQELIEGLKSLKNGGQV